MKDFKLGGGAHLKKLRRVEGGAKCFGVFRVKNNDIKPKNHIFSNFRGGGAPGAPPLDPPLIYRADICKFLNVRTIYCNLTPPSRFFQSKADIHPLRD
jgi:hypothetical protein